MIKLYQFSAISQMFSADPVADAALIADYTEYNRRVTRWRSKSKKLTAQVIKRDKVCQKCGSAENLVADHIISLRKGGSDSLDNLQALCRLCNSSKASKDRVYHRVPKWRVHK